ncbi:MAG: hypothetical protein FWF05_04260 [Oscillospiraceae bacterium]|nr:hypothetical protein [Oscillospiraceae bacterium]
MTEADLRAFILKDSVSEFTVPPDVFVTPAAREFLSARGVRLTVLDSGKTCFDEIRQDRLVVPKDGYTDAKTGQIYAEKPEDMTHLRGNLLVKKTHPVIAFRGRIDSLEADIIAAQVTASRLGNAGLTDGLQEMLLFVREILGAEVRDESLRDMTLLGLTFPELRRVSHDVKAELGLKTHPVPDYRMGELPALVNVLRTRVREAELAAAAALPERTDIITALNRLSSAVHIIFCRLLKGN